MSKRTRILQTKKGAQSHPTKGLPVSYVAKLFLPELRAKVRQIHELVQLEQQQANESAEASAKRIVQLDTQTAQLEQEIRELAKNERSEDAEMVRQTAAAAAEGPADLAAFDESTRMPLLLATFEHRKE